jgi:prepilin-type N-terminal cleavage/methylation domain-containing protein
VIFFPPSPLLAFEVDEAELSSFPKAFIGNPVFPAMSMDLLSRQPCAGRDYKKQGEAGFTLIELLIVIAIILILIAIALPNFLEAQQRAKVVRARSEVRSVGIALESYAIDFSLYPSMIEPGFMGGPPVIQGSYLKWWYLPNVLSTPVAYLQSAGLLCIFGGDLPKQEFFSDQIWQRYNYENITELIDKGQNGFALFQKRYPPAALEWSGSWRSGSVGPDQVWNPSVPYAPTNGTSSRGDIILTQKSQSGNVNFDSTSF